MSGSPAGDRRTSGGPEAKAMREQLIINAICLVIALGSLVVAAGVAATGTVERLGIDGLFAIAVCLLLAAAFSITPLLALRRGLWRQWMETRKAATAGKETQPAAAGAGTTTEEEVAEKTSESR